MESCASELVALLLSSRSSIELLLVQPSASESESSSDEGESCLRRRVGSWKSRPSCSATCFACVSCFPRAAPLERSLVELQLHDARSLMRSAAEEVVGQMIASYSDERHKLTEGEEASGAVA